MIIQGRTSAIDDHPYTMEDASLTLAAPTNLDAC